MGGLALLIMVFSKGSVTFLVVLYSINVFITFVISQLGMVCYWWKHRRTEKGWGLKFFVNGIGLCLAAFILLSMIIFKFREGGWITLLITGGLIVLALSIRRHYYSTAKLLHRLNSLVGAVEQDVQIALKRKGAALRFEPSAKTAVLLVNGFNGMGLHTLFAVIRLFGGTFKNFVFVQVGALDAGNFKSPQEMDSFKEEISKGLDRYVAYMNSQGCYAKAFFAMGVDVVEEVENLVPAITRDFKNAVFFGGQLIFPKDTFSLRFLHNYTVFTLQKRLYRQGMPFVILPIRV